MLLNRRTILKSGLGLGASLMCQNNIFGQNIKSDKSVIWIWLNGGASSIEFINPLPDAPSEIRSVRGNVKAKGGYLLGGDFNELAKIGDKLTVVRSMFHRDANHETATHWVNNSKFQIPNQGQSWPHNGAVVAKYFGSNNTKNGIPNFVKIDKIVYDDAAFLGATYMGYDADQEGIKNMRPNVESDRFKRRVDIMNTIDSHRKNEKGGLTDNWSNLKEQTVNIINGSAGKAFDISKEKDSYLREFDVGKNNFGKNCLLAARLVENGVKFVTIQHGGWDMHSDISNGFATRGVELDKYVAALIQNLEARGVLDKTLVVLASEFSRTYKLNSSASQGRDHFAGANSVVFAGGNFSHGKVVGSTSKNGSEVVESPFSPEDLTFTILSHFGISKLDIIDIQGRPRSLVPDGKLML